MRKYFAPKPMCFFLPVYIIGTCGADDVPITSAPMNHHLVLK